ncbi:MAG: hypothetical protein V1776_04655 [Candidatus Diapherotrites archaeon]
METIARLQQNGIPPQDIGWVNILVVQRRWAVQEKNSPFRQIRKITQVVEVSFVPEKGLVVYPIFEYHVSSSKWIEKKSRFLEEQFPLYFPHTRLATAEKKWVQFYSDEKKRGEEKDAGVD